MRIRGLVRALRLLVILSAPMSTTAFGQTGEAGSIFLPDRVGLPRQEFPLPMPAVPQSPRFELPDANALAPSSQRLSHGLRLTVRRFVFAGSTVFPSDTLDALAAPFLNRPIDSEDLEELRRRLTRLYINAGFLNSGAVIPDQEIKDGVVTLQLIEGTLNEIIVSGEHRFAPDFIRDRLWLGIGQPLQIGSLQENMQLLLQNAQIQRMNADLAPGKRPGQSVLRVAVTEAPRHTVGLAFANNRSPNIGAERVELLGTVRNLLGRGDSWSLRLGAGRGVADHAFNLAMPVSAHDTLLTLRHEQNHAAVVEAPFDALDIDSRSRTFEIGVRHPVWRSLRNSLALGASLSLRESVTRLGGDPFSFSAGVHDGRSEISALRFTAEWLERGPRHVVSARGQLSRGFDAFGATVNRDGTPDTRFTTALLQAQRVQQLSQAGAQLILRLDAQASDRALLPLEKFAIGGVDTVRGFRENRLVHDQGWTGSVEARIPIGQLALPGISTPPEDGQVALALFADIGQAWDRGGKKERLWGLGPGIRWDIAPDSQAQLYWAGKRKKLENTGDDPQDRGIHFRLVLQRHF